MAGCSGDWQIQRPCAVAWRAAWPGVSCSVPAGVHQGLAGLVVLERCAPPKVLNQGEGWLKYPKD